MTKGWRMSYRKDFLVLLAQWKRKKGGRRERRESVCKRNERKRKKRRNVAPSCWLKRAEEKIFISHARMISITVSFKLQESSSFRFLLGLHFWFYFEIPNVIFSSFICRTRRGERFECFLPDGAKERSRITRRGSSEERERMWQKN